MIALLVLSLLASASASRQSRVVGGDIAAPGEFPNIVALEDSGTSSYFCAGSLVDSNWVITAAHCVQGRNPGSITVVVNEYDRSQVDSGEDRIVVSKVVVHPNFGDGPGSFPNNVALLQLQSPTRAYKPSSLKAFGPFITGQTCSMAGWGYTSSSGNLATVLKKTQAEVLSSSSCLNFWGSNVSDNVVCAHNAYASMCNGDSGGPLICDGELSGVASFGATDCQSRPTVFANISVYSSWIADTIK